MENTTPQQKATIRARVKQQTIGYITSALGLVAGLAWNDAIKELIEKFVPGQNTVLAKFIYAIIITIVIVILTMYLFKIFKIEEK